MCCWNRLEPCGCSGEVAHEISQSLNGLLLGTFRVFVLPCHASTTIQMPCTVKAQGTAVRSRQEHIKLSQALHHLFGWRTQIQSLRTLRPDWHFSSTLQLPVAKHFAFSEAGATVGFWAGATEGFGQSFPGHIAIRCALSERCCVTIVKSEAQLEDSSHFTSFLVNCHPVLVLGSEWPCCWKRTLNHDRIHRLHSGALLDPGHTIAQKMMKARKDHQPIRSTSSEMTWFRFWLNGGQVSMG